MASKCAAVIGYIAAAAVRDIGWFIWEITKEDHAPVKDVRIEVAIASVGTLFSEV